MGQLALLASELFPAASRGGWVQATSATSNLRGFWLWGDAGFTTFADSAEAMTAVGEFILPVLIPATTIDLVNPTGSGQAVIIRLVGGEGQDIGEPEPAFLPPSGALHANAGSLF